MPTFTQITSPPQAEAEVIVNQALEALEQMAVFARNLDLSSGLTWAYFGGRWAGLSITAGTVALTNTNTNRIVVLRSTGAVSTSTNDTNWNNLALYRRLYRVTTAGGVVTAVEDHRAGAGGPFGGDGLGRRAIWVPARDMSPSATGGCAALATIASAANQPDIQTLDFDTTTQEFAQFSLQMPKRWALGTVSFYPVWSHAATTTNFGVVWQLQGVCVSNDDAIAVAYGTAQTSTDTGGTTNDLYMGPESAAITLAGTPAAEDHVFFRVARVPANGSDTLAIDARLHGLVLYVLDNSENDV